MVSPAGAIGLCEDGEDIDWLFLSNNAPNEDLPLTYQAAPQIRFCSKCGAPSFQPHVFAESAAIDYETSLNNTEEF